MAKSNAERIAALETDIKYLRILILASIGANFGIQFIGSPPWIITSAYVGWLASIFLIAAVVFMWHHNTWHLKIPMLLFGLLILYSVTVRSFIYAAGHEPAPCWYHPGFDYASTVVMISFIIALWHKRHSHLKEGKGK